MELTVPLCHVGFDCYLKTLHACHESLKLPELLTIAVTKVGFQSFSSSPGTPEQGREEEKEECRTQEGSFCEPAGLSQLSLREDIRFTWQ